MLDLFPAHFSPAVNSTRLPSSSFGVTTFRRLCPTQPPQARVAISATSSRRQSQPAPSLIALLHSSRRPNLCRLLCRCNLQAATPSAQPHLLCPVPVLDPALNPLPSRESPPSSYSRLCLCPHRFVNYHAIDLLQPTTQPVAVSSSQLLYKPCSSSIRAVCYPTASHRISATTQCRCLVQSSLCLEKKRNEIETEKRRRDSHGF